MGNRLPKIFTGSRICIICALFYNDCGKVLQEKNREYTCPSCGQKYHKVTQIENRKVNHICLCDGLEIAENY